MNLGQEIKRDFCPEKYCSKGSVIKDSIPTIIALIVLAFFSGNMFAAGGIDFIITLVVEIIFVVFMYGFVVLFFNGMKKRLRETHIILCENGVCGVCQAGFKNRNFEYLYTDINRMVVKGERLFLYPASGVVALTLNDAAGAAEIIRSYNPDIK